MDKTDIIVRHFRNLREEGGPSMNTGTPNGSAGFSAYADSRGPNAGTSNPLPFFKKKNGKLDGRSVNKRYKDWVKSLGMM
jgi:hypothetical protein